MVAGWGLFNLVEGVVDHQDPLRHPPRARRPGNLTRFLGTWASWPSAPHSSSAASRSSVRPGRRRLPGHGPGSRPPCSRRTSHRHPPRRGRATRTGKFVEADDRLLVRRRRRGRVWSSHSLHDALAHLGRSRERHRRGRPRAAPTSTTSASPSRPAPRSDVPVFVHENDVPLTRHPWRFDSERPRSLLPRARSPARCRSSPGFLQHPRVSGRRPSSDVVRYSERDTTLPGARRRPGVVFCPGHTLRALRAALRRPRRRDRGRRDRHARSLTPPAAGTAAGGARGDRGRRAQPRRPRRARGHRGRHRAHRGMASRGGAERPKRCPALAAPAWPDGRACASTRAGGPGNRPSESESKRHRRGSRARWPGSPSISTERSSTPRGAPTRSTWPCSSRWPTRSPVTSPVRRPAEGRR